MFLILGNRAKYLNLVHQTVSRACRYGLGTRLAIIMGINVVTLCKIKFGYCHGDNLYTFWQAYFCLAIEVLE